MKENQGEKKSHSCVICIGAKKVRKNIPLLPLILEGVRHTAEREREGRHTLSNQICHIFISEIHT
jgi:hypothetical protein